MWSTTEKMVTFFANLVTIIGFIAAALKWLDLDLIPQYDPPGKNVAVALIAAYSIASCFGTMSLLKVRTISEKSTVLMAFIFTVIIAFSNSYIRDYLISGLSNYDRDETFQIANSVSFIAYFICVFFIYITSFIYPKGMTFSEWFKGSFRWRTYQGIGLVLLLLCTYSSLSNIFLGEAAQNGKA